MACIESWAGRAIEPVTSKEADPLTDGVSVSCGVGAGVTTVVVSILCIWVAESLALGEEG